MNLPMIEDQACQGRKHDCPDCTFCQLCSDTRCNACRAGGAGGKKLSVAEQIALSDRLNQDDPVRPDVPLRLSDLPGGEREAG